MQQQAEAKKFLANQQGLAAEVQTAQNDPRALMAQEEALNAQSKNLARQEELIGAINPALKEAATQALSLLKGEKAASLGPLEQERARQRQDLLNTLREQLGPGAETSSAGQQALQNFDNQTSTILGGAQQNTLSGLLGVAQNTRAGINIGGEAGTLVNLGDAGFNRIMAGTQARSNLTSPAFQSILGTAGADQVQSQVRAQQQQRLGGELFSGALQLGAGALSGGLGGIFGGGGAAAGAGTTVGSASGLNFGNLPTL